MLTYSKVRSSGRYVNIIDSVAPSPTINGSLATPETPIRNGSIDISKTRLVSRSTPALKSIQRISSSSFSSSLTDPFTEDDGSIHGRGRKRTKFARRSGQWRLADASDEEPETKPEDGSTQSATLYITTQQPVGPVHIVDTTENVHIPCPADLIDRSTPPHVVAPEDTNHWDQRTVIRPSISTTRPDLSTVIEGEASVIVERQSSTVAQASSPTQLDVPTEQLLSGNSAAVSLPTPDLTDLATPDLPLVSSLVSQAHTSPSFATVALDLDASAHLCGQAEAQPPALHQESYGSMQVIDSRFEPQVATSLVPKENAEDASILRNTRSDMPGVAEVDLDKLQEEIEMSNVDFMPDTGEQIVEDEDLYGPPQDRDAGMNLQHVEGIENRISGAEAEPLSRERRSIRFNDEPLVVSVNESYNNQPGTTAEIGQNAELVSLPGGGDFEPYPFEIETMPSVEHDELLNTSVLVDNGPVVSQSSSARNIKPRFLDGTSADEDEDETARPTVATVPSSTVMVGESLTGASSPDAHTSTSNIGYSSAQGKRAGLEGDTPWIESAPHDNDTSHHGNPPNQVFTPEATQVTEVPGKDETTVNRHVRGQFPPTPMDSQRAASQQSVGAASVDDVHADEPIVLVQPLIDPASKVMSDIKHMRGIVSPYFTHQVVSKKPTLEPANQSLSTPAVAEVEPISSSPTNQLLEDFEDGKIAETIATQQDIPSENQRWIESNGGIATALGFYVHLNTLDEYYNQRVDIIAICAAECTAPYRAKSEPKDFHTTVRLVDRSTQETNITTIVEIFRPDERALPAVRQGDVLLLRQFKVQTRSQKPMLLSTDGSAWAIYRIDGSAGTPSEDKIKLVDQPIISGPPVEHGPAERRAAEALIQWWYINGPQTQQGSDSPPARSPEGTGNQRFKKPVPPHIDLRRSTRTTRRNTSSDVDPSPTSPSFGPESPIAPHGEGSSPVFRTSPRSIAPGRNNPSPVSPFRTGGKAMPSPSITSPRSRATTRAQRLLTPSSPVLDRAEGSVAEGQGTMTQNFSSSDSVASSVTEMSGRGKRRRYKRRSTSLVHKLRDGTEWIDVEQEEIFSESASEEDDQPDGADDNMNNNGESATLNQPGKHRMGEANPTADIQQGHGSNSKSGGQSVRIDTKEPSTSESPSNRARGRPRKQDEFGESHHPSVPQPPSPLTPTTGSAPKPGGRITRSQMATATTGHTGSGAGKT